MIKKVFILGNHIQALGLARQIKNIGVSVILFTDTKFSITRYSNAIKKTFICSSQDDLLSQILRFDDSGKNILLFPTNDEMVYFLHTNYELLKEKYYLGIPKPETVDVFYNKRNTYQFAAKHNIPIPESWFPDSIADVEDLSPKIKYPVIIKPAIMHSFHKTFGKKAVKCRNKEELLEKIIWISNDFPVEHLVIQEFLDGGAKTLYSYGTFAAKGQAIASLIANRIRQNPMDFGNSTTFAKTCYIPEIKEIAEKILKLTDYFGLAEIEFMYDKKSNQYKFLEINTRAWKWHSISNALGYGFIEKMITNINNNDLYEIKEFNKEFAWVERLTDVAVIIKELLKGNFFLKDVIKSYRIRKEYAVWSLSDLRPFIMYLILAPVLFFKRH